MAPRPRHLDSGRGAGHCKAVKAEDGVMTKLGRLVLVAAILVGVAGALAACGDTWRGFKEDTGENLEKTGEAIEKGGEAIKP